jgi:hypothetical protein
MKVPELATIPGGNAVRRVDRGNIANSTRGGGVESRRVRIAHQRSQAVADAEYSPVPRIVYAKGGSKSARLQRGKILATLRSLPIHKRSMYLRCRNTTWMLIYSPANKILHVFRLADRASRLLALRMIFFAGVDGHN